MIEVRTDPEFPALWIVVGPSQYDETVESRYMITGDLGEAVRRMRKLEKELFEIGWWVINPAILEARTKLEERYGKDV